MHFTVTLAILVISNKKQPKIWADYYTPSNDLYKMKFVWNMFGKKQKILYPLHELTLVSKYIHRLTVNSA